MKVYVAFLPGDVVGGVFKNKRDAFKYIETTLYNTKKLNQIENSIGVAYTNSQIKELINGCIDEFELQ
jgi:hypothetical protein